ncbi:flagellar hook-associated protein 3 [Thermoclostridium stercorarium subsp. stercorarium DSM 8532]|uniref:Flagellar hook-associated protein 3 n=1 Tax=Thermoclostridium stercorarium (strain ATCC 35414 / DSM 8532 / NCIMB 11754) TaxID=1121335 RepID=L7VVC8_THES1|nr:flagellar hook-associated protein FlgL [Thermoclostridium stercorarium]AGC69533.1 flagellar hook-associated protein 3 [Thermoclostridium stercorarium subsp. stercorarium DSM 8532]AGI40486.1 flagellar hook protein-3 [Thermoclostridium stercorarium subsp. stercorarium DSM 8532]
MRITNNMLINNMLSNLSNSLNRVSKYQNQVASKKKISLPSDDPIVASRALKLRTDVAEIEQYKRNVDDAESWMEITETTIMQIENVMQRARELTVDAANGTKTPEDMAKIKAEIEQLKAQMIQLANTTYSGRYIFSGFKTDKALLDEQGNFLIEVSDDEKMFYEIGIGDDIDVNVVGCDLFHGGSKGVAEGTKSRLIGTFDNLIAALESGNEKAVGDVIADIDTEIENILRVLSAVGARTNRLELTSNRLDDDYINFTKLMSKNEDVDLAEAIMHWTNEMNVYNAALAVGAKVIQPTLVDFLL